jgi:putative endonuclease
MKSNIYYVGYTDNVERRIAEHNNPQRTKFTSKHLPWDLKSSFFVAETRGDAMKAERYIKKKKSRIYIENLIKNKIEQEKIAQLARVPQERD